MFRIDGTDAVVGVGLPTTHIPDACSMTRACGYSWEREEGWWEGRVGDVIVVVSEVQLVLTEASSCAGALMCGLPRPYRHLLMTSDISSPDV